MSAAQQVVINSVPVTVVAPDSDPIGGVIVVQEAFGVTEHIIDICRRLATAGFVAAAPHLYHRQGDPVFGGDQLKDAMPALRALIGPDIVQDLAAAREALVEEGAERVGIVGFCMGGSIALWASSFESIAAAVSFYGSGLADSRWPGVPSGLETAASISAPWLGVYGDQDTSIPVDDVEKMREAVRAADVDTQIVRYPEAGHAFNNDSRAQMYRPEAAADAWHRTLLWFETYLS